MIARDTIEAIKRDIDLVALIRAKGIELRKNGKGYFGRCPFHDDKTPSLSVTPEDNLWQCFGCGAGGDPIRFVELFDRVGFVEAVAQLTDGGHKAHKPTRSKPASEPLTVAEGKLLARVVAYYQYSLGQDRRGSDYLKEERGITHHQSLIDFGAGFANGTLNDILPEDEAVTASLMNIGILNDRGNERFYRCVTFPLYDQDGAVVNLYGRRIEAGGVTHLYLPGPRRGLVNRQAARRSETLILAESIIDALTLYDRGYTNTVPVYGTGGFTDEHLSLFNRRTKAAYLVFDADAAGIKAARTTALR
jgi:DNA primase catalytic core